MIGTIPKFLILVIASFASLLITSLTAIIQIISWFFAKISGVLPTFASFSVSSIYLEVSILLSAMNLELPAKTSSLLIFPVNPFPEIFLKSVTGIDLIPFSFA